MIITPSCQLFLDMQNNVVDKGHGGLTWVANGGTSEEFTDGLFGRAYDFVSPTNWLSAGTNINPLNISDEFTLAAHFYYAASAVNPDDWFQIFDFGRQTGNASSDNRGISAYVQGAYKLGVSIESDNPNGYNGSNRGRIISDFNVKINTNNFIAVSRTPTTQKLVLINEDGIVVEDYSFSLNTNILWRSRIWRIGAVSFGSDDNSLNRVNENGYMDKCFVANKALNMEDILRLNSLMHPLNG